VPVISGAAAILVLLVLTGVHVCWAAGGKAGKGAAIPSADGQPVIKPSAIATALVAVALGAMAALVALRISGLRLPFLAGNSIIVQAGAWLVAAVFALRAVGDFRYVGFFKKVRGSRFARLDTLAYSPLCACLALLTGIAAGT
jgi:hypothetical protein